MQGNVVKGLEASILVRQATTISAYQDIGNLCWPNSSLACEGTSAEQMLGDAHGTTTHHDVVIRADCDSPFVSVIISFRRCSLAPKNEGQAAFESTYLNASTIS